MGMEQGGYIEGDEQGTYGYGGGGGFDLSMGGGGDSFIVDYAADYGGAYNFTGDYSGVGTGAEYGDSGYQPGGDLYGAYVDYYTESGFDLTTAMELAAQDAAAGSVEIATSERGLLPDALGPETYYGLPYIPEPFLTPYTPIFPDLPAPLPPVITPLIPLTVQPPPQTPLPQTPTTGQQPIAPGLPPACPTGQYHPHPIGHPDQNKCVPFPPPQLGSAPSPQQRPAAPSGGSSTSKPPAQQQQQQKCPTGYYLDPATKQCKPIPQGQPQSCPAGYYRASNGQCLLIPKCATPGTVFDQARGLCVPKGQAISPLPEGVEGLFDELSKLPWWVWLALGGLLLLNRDEDGKKTTVTYRRAR
jgi:hypothetical protein